MLNLKLVFLSLLFISLPAYADKEIDVYTPAQKAGVNVLILEGICRYESDSGRVKVHRNKNGSWDVGYCQNHRGKTKKQPPIPRNQSSVNEAAKELQYWYTQHQRFCVDLYKETKKCGVVRHGKWRGVKRCHKPHFWWAHYNHGFRVLSNKYDYKVNCFIKNGFKRCHPRKWGQVKPPAR